MVHMIYLMFICIGAPLLLMLFLLEKQSRVTVGYMILGIVMCLFAGEVNALLMQLLRLNLQYAAVSLTPITEEIIKALPVLFYAFVISEKWERLLSLSMALGIGFAIMENVYVVTQNIESADVLLALIRGFATGLMHGICTATVGYGISFVRKCKKLFYTGTFGLLLVAVIYHGIFNTLVQSPYQAVGFFMPIVTYIPVVVCLNGLISGNAFEAGDTDVINLIGMPDVGDIVSITVRKDGDDDWHPHTIAVNESIFVVFREVGNETFTNDNPSTARQYTVTVQVSGASGAGTNDDIYICIFGDKGQTSTLLLDKVNYDDFEAGDKDTYTVWGQDVGTINAIRLSWENPNSDFEYDDDVLIEYCEVDGLGFNINRWLGSESIWWAEAWPCELKDYDIKFQTGTFDYAGTDVGVWLNIIGKNGDETGYIYVNSYIDGNAFENGNLDCLTLRTKDVGEIEKIKISPFNNSCGWYLEYVEIDGCFFNAKQWVEESDIELAAVTSRTYDVRVQTGLYGSSGTDDDVLLTIFGTNGSTGVFRLNGYVEDEEFEKGGLNTMKLKGLDVGTITDILVKVDGGDGWYLEYVTVEGKTYPAQMWLEYSSAELKAAAVTTHYIKITTADKWLAGTDGDVYIELIGSDGQSTGKILLDEDGKNDFERNESFVYTLRNVKDVGTITKAILSLEDGDDWCVGSVSIDNGEVYTYNQWLEEGEQITINLTKDTTYSGSGFFSFFGFFGSMVSSGSIWIIVGIAVALAAAAVITVIVVKKRKKTAG